MNIISRAGELRPAGRPVCAAIGVFDGIHRGHRQIIDRAVAEARRRDGLAVVINFDAHPKTILAPQSAPPWIYPLAKRLELFAELGVDTTVLLHFDRAFSQITAEDFVRGLARDFGRWVSLSVGRAFTFGARRQGNLERLEQWGAELGFEVFGLAAVLWEGLTLSSTRVREAIRAGRLAAVAEMLGRPYSIVGPVIRGDQWGRQLGFPTANLDCAGLVLPPAGVYAGRATVAGQPRLAVLNIGSRPTVTPDSAEMRVEAHLVDFHGDLYGQNLEVILRERFRAEQKFPSREALAAQIQSDVALARARFGI